MIHKRKKNSRQRATQTHGWGAKKKHRGAGNRGGRGNANTGKRGDARKPCIWKEKYFGKFGFVNKRRREMSTINLDMLESLCDKLAAAGKVKKEKDMYTIDLTALGYDKLLGTGKCTCKFNITVKNASANAVEKVSAAGGNVELVESAEAPEEISKEQ